MVVTAKGATLKGLRKHSAVGGRELARRLAEARGDEGDQRAIEAARQFLLRLERREGDAELTDEEAAAIADSLGVEVDDLGAELRWAVGKKEEPMWFGGVIPCWTDAGAAGDFRDFLVMGKFLKADAQVVPATRSVILATLGATTPRWNPEASIIENPSREMWGIVMLLALAVSGRHEPSDEDILLLHSVFGLPQRTDQAAERLAYMVQGGAPQEVLELLERDLTNLARFAERALALRVKGALSVSAEAKALGDAG